MAPPPPASRLRALHAPGGLLVLPNAWDPGSARLVEELGAAAVATTSAGLAWSLGWADGERLPRERLVQALGEVLAAVRVPVTVDLERGYGAGPAEVAALCCRLAASGVAGVNLEEGGEPPALLAARLRACREALDRQGLDLFLNARVDLLLGGAAAAPLLEELLARAGRYRDAGADGVFVPGALDPATLARLATAVPLPLNVWASPALPGPDELRALGVRRVSLGTGLARAALSAARRSAQAALAGRWAEAEQGITFTYQELDRWFRPTRSTAALP